MQTKPKHGNLGNTIIKRTYLCLEIILQFLAIGDIAGKAENRWTIQADRPKLITIGCFLGAATLVNIILLFCLAFHSYTIEKKTKDVISFIRPVINLILMLTCLILLQYNGIHILFNYSNSVFCGLSAIYMSLFLYSTLPRALKIEKVETGKYHNKTSEYIEGARSDYRGTRF